jgi:SPFH domain / Band 7 family
MKKVRIKENEVGLALKNDSFVKILPVGTAWFWGNETVEVYKKGEAFDKIKKHDYLLQNQEIVDALNIVEVGDNELVLKYIDNRFETVLITGKYAFWKGVSKNTFIKVDLGTIEIDSEIDTNVLSKIPLYVRNYTVESYEKGLLFVDGKFTRELSAGTYYWWKNNISIHVAKVDTRTLQMEISGQEILTKDKAGVRLNFQAQYKVSDIKVTLLENKEYEKQLYVLMQLALREYVGTYTLDELLDKKSDVSNEIFKSVSEKAKKLGVEILDGGIKDIILPGDMKDIMNQVLVAEKKAQANIIMRREETASMRSMLNTAKLMEDNEMLFRLKEMEYVEKIAENINTISVTGGGQIFDQLKQLFVADRKVKA